MAANDVCRIARKLKDRPEVAKTRQIVRHLPVTLRQPPIERALSVSPLPKSPFPGGHKPM